jgi:hypothetical protein
MIWLLSLLPQWQKRERELREYELTIARLRDQLAKERAELSRYRRLAATLLRKAVAK